MEKGRLKRRQSEMTGSLTAFAYGCALGYIGLNWGGFYGWTFMILLGILIICLDYLIEEAK